MSRGDCVVASVGSSGLTDCLFVGVSSTARALFVDTRGVMIDEDDCGRSVRDRTDVEALDCGREDVSGASSNVSCISN